MGAFALPRGLADMSAGARPVQPAAAQDVEGLERGADPQHRRGAPE